MPLLALLAALVTALTLTAPAHAASSRSFGVQVLTPTADVTTARIDADLDLAQRVGVGVVRVEALWSAIEPEAEGRRDARVIAALDHFADGARRRGLRILLLIDSAPCWASAAPDDVRGDCGPGADRREAQRYPPRDPQQFARFAAFLTARYAGVLSGVELWNEPDQRNELYWKGPDKINRYVAMTRAVYPAIKAVAPRVPVLAGAFVGTDGRWLTALYQAGFKGTYDVLSVHFYDLTLEAVRRTRAVQRQFGDRAPMALGETGWTSCSYRGVSQEGHLCVGRAAQARFTADLVRAVRRTPWVQQAIFFTARDSEAYDFGLVDRAGRAKPVATTLRRELRSRRARPVRRISLRVVRRGGSLVLQGSGPAAEVYRLVATSPRGRLRAPFRLDRDGRFSVVLNPALGARGIKVSVRAPFTRRTASRRIG